MSLFQLDRQLFDFLNHGFNSPALDLFMSVLSSWVFWRPFVLIAAAFALVFGGFKGRAFVCCAVLIVLVVDDGVANPLKHFTNRPRPYQAMAGVRIVQLQETQPRFFALIPPAVVSWSTLPPKTREDRSFPSGHVTNNFALAAVLAWFYRRRGWLYFIIATLVAWSRVYKGDHYPSDVVSSAVIGAGVAVILMMVLDFLWRNYGARFLPTLHSAHPTLLCE